VSCLAVLLLLGAALGVVAAMVHAHRVGQSAADLAALAGAGAIGGGRDPCSAGAATAAANGARLVSCAVDGRVVTVTVEVAGPRWLGQTADLTAEARAGPG
jgi:secretion/DNA translocation related TadE-like protein